MLDLYVQSGSKKLRCGYTTGSTATAAAAAAAYILFNKKEVEYIEIDTPKGITLKLPLNTVENKNGKVKVSILKDAGDDFDVTDGIEIFAEAEAIESGFILDCKEGIGKVTKDGLSIKKGEYAINTTPRRTIKEEVLKVTPENKGVKITLSIPLGEEIAKKTFNNRLGIEGGISIIGTTGIVYPMSEEALKESIAIEIKQKAKERLVLTFGNMGENCAKELGFKEDEIVIISNFVGFAIDTCILEKVKEIVLVGHIGKMSKIAYGCFNTHSRVNDVRLEVFALELTLLGYPLDLIKEVLEQKTSEGAVKILGEGYKELYLNIGNKILSRLDIYSYGELKSNAIFYYGYTEPKVLFNSLKEE